MQVAVGRHPHLLVFGGDYPTRDGTCIRDYIHVVDLAQGHLAALGKLAMVDGVVAYNLGTGRGYTVLEVVAAATRAVGHAIPFEIVGRRPGDAVAVWADPHRAERELDWRAQRDIDTMCADAWRWQHDNPWGFAAPAGTPTARSGEVQR
jgi:UDP-glucose 4-epimerase